MTVDIDELERLAREAEHGEWSLECGPDGWFEVWVKLGEGAGILCQRSAWPHRAEKSIAAGRHIVAAQPSTLLSLISELREARKVIAAMEQLERAER